MDFFWKIWKIRNATLIWRADNGDNDVAKMHNEKRHKKGNALSERARIGHHTERRSPHPH